VHVRQISPLQEVVPVVFTPPEEVPKPQVEIKEEEPEPQDTTVEQPQIVTIVAAADSANVAFAVPVEGAVAVAKEARFAAPPPAVTKAPQAGPTIFRPGNEAGNFPWPKTYPREALMKRLQGTTMLYVEVDPTGVPVKVEVKTSSKSPDLDDAAVQWVKKNWRWQPGELRLYNVPFLWRLE
jgi:protein TonB